MCDCEGDLDDGVLDDSNGAHTGLPGALLRTRTSICAAQLCFAAACCHPGRLVSALQSCPRYPTPLHYSVKTGANESC